MNILSIIGTFLATTILAFLGASSSPLLGGGTGTLNQLDQWKSDGTHITQAVASRPVKLTGLEALNCLGTDVDGILGSGTCGGGGGGSFPFGTGTNYGQLVYSTTTPTLWFRS